MTYELLAFVSGLIISGISSFGYLGIVVAMALESACIPLPSEVIMPFSGYLVSTGRFSFWGVALTGALGCSIGSAVAYYIGLKGGRPFLEKYGRYLLITEVDLKRADRWFERYGEKATFISRLLPVIRTFISLPAGIAGMRFGRFLLYSFLGSLPWTAALAYVGMILGERWETVGGVLRRLDVVIAAAILILVALFIRWKLKELRTVKAESQDRW